MEGLETILGPKKQNQKNLTEEEPRVVPNNVSELMEENWVKGLWEKVQREK